MASGATTRDPGELSGSGGRMIDVLFAALLAPEEALAEDYCDGILSGKTGKE